MDSTTVIAAVIFSLASAIAGVIFAVFMARKSRAAHQGTFDNADSVLKNGERRRAIILDEAQRATREQFENDARRQEEERAVVLRLQDDFEQELNERQSELDKKANDLVSTEAELEEKSVGIGAAFEKITEVQQVRVDVQKEWEGHLESRANVNRSDMEYSLHEEIVNAEKLGMSRWLIDHSEGFKADARKYAREALSSVYLRYSPTFVWPKIPFTVETTNKDVAERHFNAESPLLPLLLAGTDSAIDLLVDGNGTDAPSLKISGGAGVDKEALRLTLEEMVSRNSFNPDRVKQMLVKHRNSVDKLALKMGEEALKILGLPTMHPEILKLIGALNYRTSHRQNQYFHSLEVARLAGMLADEVGVDHQLAKRSGILHDIGKVLDYKIEGSHAVISGDYALRYGESELVVDTVLSHHDDKVVETPHAYILKAADAMSGARPGARVDMEEGYQKRIEGINEVVTSFREKGVVGSAIMHAGREVHVFVDNRRIKERDVQTLAADICRKLESDVQFPGQIRVTVVRRLEVSEVA